MIPIEELKLFSVPPSLSCKPKVLMIPIEELKPICGMYAISVGKVLMIPIEELKQAQHKAPAMRNPVLMIPIEELKLRQKGCVHPSNSF